MDDEWKKYAAIQPAGVESLESPGSEKSNQSRLPQQHQVSPARPTFVKASPKQSTSLETVALFWVGLLRVARSFKQRLDGDMNLKGKHVVNNG